MGYIEPTILLITHQECCELCRCLHSLVQLLTCKHFVEDVAGAEDITLLVVLLIEVIVYLLKIDLRG